MVPENIKLNYRNMRSWCIGRYGNKLEIPSSDADVVINKSIFVLYITWPITQTAIKISILLFYSNLFIKRYFLVAAYTTIAVVSVWCVEQIAASLLLCRPISYHWNTDQEGHCGNVMASCLAGAAINVLTDLVILVLPVPIIWSLNIPLKSKLSLSFIFGLGFL